MSVSVLIETVEVEGFGGGGVVAPPFGNVQVAGLFDGRDDGGADGSQVGGAADGYLPAQQDRKPLRRSASGGSLAAYHESYHQTMTSSS